MFTIMDRYFAFIYKIHTVTGISFLENDRVFVNLVLLADGGNFYQVYFFAIMKNGGVFEK